jgi:hypothetical protein
MRPAGLICKKDGELMIVHVCVHCNAISTNRLAGDDISFVVLDLLYHCEDLSHRGISLLTESSKPEVLICLYGYDNSPIS